MNSSQALAYPLDNADAEHNKLSRQKRDNIHRYASCYECTDLLFKAMGFDLDVKIFKRHLEQRYCA